MPRVFKIPCYNSPPRAVSGDLIAEAAGVYYSLQIIAMERCEYGAVSVLSYEDNSVGFSTGFSSLRDLCEFLHSLSSFDSADDDDDDDDESRTFLPRMVFESAARSWDLDPVTMNQDVREVAGDVLDLVRRYVSGLESTERS
jgi:hypothetical protein